MRCIWFREDLRVEDNLALSYAAQGEQVWGLFLMTPAWWQRHHWGPNKKAALIVAVQDLACRLAALNIPLIVRTVIGEHIQEQVSAVLRCLDDHKTDQLYFNRQYEIHETERDLKIAHFLLKKAGKVFAFDDLLLFQPGTLRTLAKQPFTVFTPFKKKALSLLDQMIVAAPPIKKQEVMLIKSQLEDLKSMQSVSDLSHLPITRDQVLARLRFFSDCHLSQYDQQRDYPAKDGTSKLGVALTLGTLSIRELWATIEHQPDSSGREIYRSELLWREFYKHILIDFPHVCRHKPFKKEYEEFQWDQNTALFEQWQLGMTGYPLVDAGMRQLRQEGWMHNRLRMICGMFLTKILLQSWQQGEQEFSHWLTDYDFAANNGGWQWVASTGTDAVPYFRIFSPWSQTERFDPDGDYIKKYIPELRSLSGAQLACPDKLKQFAPKTYPKMIIDYKAARQRTLSAFKQLKH